MGFRLVEKLFQKAEIEYERHYGLLVITAPEAERFFEWCLEKGIGVLGFEAFIIRPGETRPLLRWSPYLTKYQRYPNFSENSVRYLLYVLQELHASEGDEVYLEEVYLEVYVDTWEASQYLQIHDDG